MKKVSFAKGELSLLRRRLHEPEAIRIDEKARQTILAKLAKAEQPNDPGVNAPALEETLITYSRGKVVSLALPNWQRYSRQGADVGATVADAQTIGEWMYRQGWIQLGSQTLESALRNWSSWLGKARASEPGQRPEAGLHGTSNVGPGTGAQRPATQGRRPAPGFR
jgi:hypothetical protein